MVVAVLEEEAVQEIVAAGWVWWRACSGKSDICRLVDDGVWVLRVRVLRSSQ